MKAWDPGFESPRARQNLLHGQLLVACWKFMYAVRHNLLGPCSLLIDCSELLLGAFAGLTIFFGLPIAAAQRVSTKKKWLLTSIAIGILIFLMVDVFSHAWTAAADAVSSALLGRAPSAILSLT